MANTAGEPSAVVRPLPGSGLVARSGDLLLVCADSATGVDELLAVFDEVAAAGGDGSALVRRLAALLASDEQGWFPACAVSGPARDGRCAVLVSGAATAELRTADGVVALSGEDAITTVDRLVAGPVESIRLTLDVTGPTDLRTRLDAGVVVAGGLHWAAADRPAVDSGVTDGAAQAEPVVESESAATVVGADETGGDDPEPAVEVAADGAEEYPLPQRGEALARLTPSQEPSSAESSEVEPGSAVAVSAEPPASVAAAPPLEPVFVSPPAAPMPPAPMPPAAPMPAAPPSAPPQAAPWPPPPGGAAAVDAPPPAAPTFDAAPADPVAQSGFTVVWPEPGQEPGGDAVTAARPGGVLLLDDGSRFELDTDYVIGREPQHDPDVVAGSARPLRIVDSEGVVSRRHARIAVVGSTVSVIDLGSANGTFIEPAGAAPDGAGRRQVPAGESVVLEPGVQVTLGRRWLRYEP